MISEHIKQKEHAGKQYRYYYWRDHHGVEVDLIKETAQGIEAIEIKSGYTIKKDHLKNLERLKTYAKTDIVKSVLYYSGDETYQWGQVQVLPWHLCSNPHSSCI